MAATDLAIQCHRPFMFQTMDYVRSNTISLKYQRFTSLGCKDVGQELEQLSKDWQR